MRAHGLLILLALLLLSCAGCESQECVLPDAGGVDAGGDASQADGDGGQADGDGGQVDGDGDAGGVDAGSDGGEQGLERLTVVALNTHSLQEGDDSLDKLEWIGRGLAALGADLVGLNEVMSGTIWAYDYGGAQIDCGRLIQESLERASGQAWHSASFAFGRWDAGEEMSNVVLSRWPILESRRRELTTTDAWPAPAGRRNVVFARIAVPDIGLVHFFVTHPWGWESADAAVQIDEIKAFVEEQSRGDERLTLLAGDLNTPSTWVNYQRWTQGAPFAFFDTYARSNPEGFADSTVFDGEHRIDYILLREGSIFSSDPPSYRSNLVFDGLSFDGLSTPVVSDHKGVLTVFPWTGR